MKSSLTCPLLTRSTLAKSPPRRRPCDKLRGMRRREFLVLSAASIGGVLVYSLDRKVSRLSAQDRQIHSHSPSLFSPRDGKRCGIAAATARIFPTDDTGPGAKEAGVAIFIDRQLAGPWGRDRFRYTQAPFDENATADFGYQGKATPQQIYRQGLKDLAGFDQLPPDQQDQKLKQIESSVFFNLLRRNTIEGMFCDPMHGGNADMVGWQMIGFPGPRMSNYGDVDKHFGEAFRPKPVSLQQVAAHPVKPLEEEQ